MIINNAQLTDQQLLDLDKLVDLANEHDGATPPIYKHLIILKRDTASNFLYYTAAIGTQAPQLIGFLGLYFFYPETCEISVLVHPDFRHQHVAQGLLKEALPLCQLKRTKQLLFSTPHPQPPSLLKAMKAALHHSEYHLVRDSPPPTLPHSRLTLREAHLSDVSRLCDLDRACFETDDATMQDRFLILLTDANYKILVAELAGTIIGKLHLRYDTNEAELSDFCILPEHQHQGLGGEFLALGIDYAAQKKFTRIALDVETKSLPILKLYTKQGFEVVRSVDFYSVKIEDALLCLNSM